MCHFMNLHNNHKLLRINDEEELKKENISIEESSKDLENNKNKLEELKSKIENEMIKIDNLYVKIDKEVTESYKIKHEKLTEEENELKDKLKNEVTKIKESLELNMSKISELLRNSERIIKGIKSLTEENQLIKKLNYVSNINKNQKEINAISRQLMKNLNISFYGDNNTIKYEEYFFNGLPKLKDIQFISKNPHNFKISWKIDDINLINLDKNQIKFKVEMKKKNENNYISVYEGTETNCTIKNLEAYTCYDIIIYCFNNLIKSDCTKVYEVKTDLDSVILDKSEKKDEYINKIIEWCGYKSMKLLYRGTRDGMTSKNFHDKCDNIGKTICLFLNNKENIFGGYSSIRWESTGEDKTANDCFLFTLKNIYNTEPTKFPYEKGRSVYHNSSHGPIFGGGSDLGFGSDFLSNQGCWTYFPVSYKDILGKGKSVFTGEINNNNPYYILKELEIFEVYN